MNHAAPVSREKLAYLALGVVYESPSAVEDLTRKVQNQQRSLQFSVDEASGRTIIKVIDKETDQVIRQIPTAEVIAIARRIEDAVGVLLEDKA